MDEAQIQMHTALRLAQRALEQYETEDTIGAEARKNAFRQWRDASELAVKWYRQWRMSGNEEDASFEDELAAAGIG